MRSSWRWRRSSSPESFAPPRRGMLRSLLSRSRSRSSCSDGGTFLRGVEEPQELGDRRPELGPGDDPVDVPEAVILLGETEVLGQLLADELLDDARAGERHQSAGLGEED